MPNEYRTSQGVFSDTPLEDVFAPKGSITKIDDIGFSVNGSDISNLYAPLASGSATTATGFQVGGNDLNTLFAGIGTIPPTVNITNHTSDGISYDTDVVFLSVSLNTNGTLSFFTDATVPSGSQGTIAGQWLTSGVAADVSWRATWSGGGGSSPPAGPGNGSFTPPFGRSQSTWYLIGATGATWAVDAIGAGLADGVADGTINIELGWSIPPAAPTVLASATINISVTSDAGNIP